MTASSTGQRLGLTSVAARIRSVPLAGHSISVLELPIQLVDRYFHRLTTGHFWQSDCEYEVRSSIDPGWYGVQAQLMNIPSDTLIEMLFLIVTGEVALTANDVAEIEQLQRELQRRGEEQYWSLRTFD
jgi:hypothetical protein